MGTKEDRRKNRDKRLEELAQALKEAQLLLLGQRERLDAVDKTGEHSAQALAELREQLVAVTAERDKLQDQLLALERMQTETVALPDDEGDEPCQRPALPTIEELMGELSGSFSGSERGSAVRRLSGPTAEAPESEWQEMLPPDAILPETMGGAVSRALIDMDSDERLQIALRDGTNTIGRAESADIRLDEPFASRIHARIICGANGTILEDAGSKNGCKVNSARVERQALAHGDVLEIAHRRFTFIDRTRRV